MSGDRDEKKPLHTAETGATLAKEGAALPLHFEPVERLGARDGMRPNHPPAPSVRILMAPGSRTSPGPFSSAARPSATPPDERQAPGR